VGGGRGSVGIEVKKLASGQVCPRLFSRRFPQSLSHVFVSQFLAPSSCDKVKNQIITKNETLYGGKK
jgi:hypothetical protein